MFSCIGKILERMINKRLIWIAEKKLQLDKNQNEFKRGRSCIDNLVRLITDIELSRETNQYTVVAVFLDIKLAYDNVRTDILCDILKEKGCPEKIIKYINVWMRNRIIKFYEKNMQRLEQ